MNQYQAGEVVLTLRPLPPLLLNRWKIEYDKKNKPVMPMTEVTYVGGKRGVEYHPNDEAYKVLKAEYDDNFGQAQYEYIINYCVVTDPPTDFVVPEELGENTLKNRRIVWVLELIGLDNMEEFTKACFGQNMPTEEDIEAEMDSYKSNSGGSTDNPVPLPSPAEA